MAVITQKIKNSVKSAVKFINNFETTVCEIAVDNEFEYVICGHIHHPEIKTVTTEKGGTVTYMNSGDWIENLTSLEYNDGAWSIYKYAEDAVAQSIDINRKQQQKETSKEMMVSLLQELKITIKPSGLSGSIEAA